MSGQNPIPSTWRDIMRAISRCEQRNDASSVSWLRQADVSVGRRTAPQVAADLDHMINACLVRRSGGEYLLTEEGRRRLRRLESGAAPTCAPPEAPPSLSEAQAAVLRALAAGRKESPSAVAKRLDVQVSAARMTLHELEVLELVAHSGAGAKSRWQITTPGRAALRACGAQVEELPAPVPGQGAPSSEGSEPVEAPAAQLTPPVRAVEPLTGGSPTGGAAGWGPAAVSSGLTDELGRLRAVVIEASGVSPEAHGRLLASELTDLDAPDTLVAAARVLIVSLAAERAAAVAALRDLRERVGEVASDLSDMAGIARPPLIERERAPARPSARETVQDKRRRLAAWLAQRPSALSAEAADFLSQRTQTTVYDLQQLVRAGLVAGAWDAEAGAMRWRAVGVSDVG